MPAVNLRADTYRALESAARASGINLDEAAELAVERFLAGAEVSDEAFRDEWAALRASLMSHMPAEVTPEQIERDIDAATGEVWAERRRARSR
jgi:hypothetical protein